MLPEPRLTANVDHIGEVLAAHVPGDIVEVGVWKGGSVMSLMLALLAHNVTDRMVHLYDTFSGMTPPSDVDVGPGNISAAEYLTSGHPHMLAKSGLDEVQRNVWSLTRPPHGYLRDKVLFHEGDITTTLPEDMPRQIAMIRLDTDWYESTRWELEHFWPLVQPGGIMVIDDVGHWLGSQKATLEWAGAHPEVLLERITGDEIAVVVRKTVP